MEGQRCRRRAVVCCTCRRTGRRHFEGERRVKMQSYEGTFTGLSDSIVHIIVQISTRHVTPFCVSHNGYRRA
ncbi:hypothetical protein PAMP_007709 [Pampus punctatissimus]